MVILESTKPWAVIPSEFERVRSKALWLRPGAECLFVGKSTARTRIAQQRGAERLTIEISGILVKTRKLTRILESVGIHATGYDDVRGAYR